MLGTVSAVISVVIPVHNAGRYLAECLASLTSQDFPADDYEVIVVDNNSTDASLEIAESFGRVRVLSERRQGAYAARNTGIAAASGDIIAFTDPDCVCELSWLSVIRERLSEPSLGIVLGRRLPARDGTLLGLVSGYENCKAEYVFTSGSPLLYFGYANNMAVRRRLLERQGLFVERQRGADAVFVRRAVDMEGSGVVGYEPNMIVRHLEIDGVLAYFRKVFIYGRSHGLYRHIVRSEPLSRAERLRSYAAAVRRSNGGLGSAILLLGVLIAGWLCWKAGCWSCALIADAEASSSCEAPRRRLFDSKR
jgi:O-antigen biosynthesis protein